MIFFLSLLSLLSGFLNFWISEFFEDALRVLSCTFDTLVIHNADTSIENPSGLSEGNYC